ncbi:hypothetical protein ABTF26_20310, partial [Acinetobacter baumannii]
ERLLLPAGATVPPAPTPAAQEDARLTAVARALDIDPRAAATRALLHRVLSLVDAVDRLAIWEEAYERPVVAELAPPTAPVLREIAPS